MIVSTITYLMTLFAIFDLRVYTWICDINGSNMAIKSVDYSAGCFRIGTQGEEA
jgi:hypothetical protein